MSKIVKFSIGIVVAACIMTAGGAEKGSSRECPLTLGPQCQVEIDSIIFMDQLEVTRYKYKISEEKLYKMRYALVCLKITKPTGKRLTLAAADLTLHYYNGEDTEVAPCSGLSTFGKYNDADRPYQLRQYSGPGFTKKTTGARSTQSGVVYIDALFQAMEPDTKECWICVAQPTTSQPYVCPTPAWSNK